MLATEKKSLMKGSLGSKLILIFITAFKDTDVKVKLKLIVIIMLNLKWNPMLLKVH